VKVFLRHAFEQMFVILVSIAAFVHSTWTIGTFFSGVEPNATLDLVRWLEWVGPAGFIAFALDIGQIRTAFEIRAGSRTKLKYFTFFVFALFTYYLQFVYLAYHFPSVSLSEGIPADWAPLITGVAHLCIFVLPALLPATTVLYTFSHDNHDRKADEPVVKEIIKEVSPVILSPVIEPVNSVTLDAAKSDIIPLLPTQVIASAAAVVPVVSGPVPEIEEEDLSQELDYRFDEASGTYSWQCPTCKQQLGYKRLGVLKRNVKMHMKNHKESAST